MSEGDPERPAAGGRSRAGPGRGRDDVLADPSQRGSDLCRALADWADGWLAAQFPGADGIALVAVGGYGRRELSPGSDLDLLLLHRGRKDIRSLAESFWYPLWDSGIPVDHSVRTIKEALAAAEADLAVVLGLLDGRHIAGDPSLTERLLTDVHQQWARWGVRRLPALAESVEERHARAGEVAFLLEPDLKEGRGGLRDVAALRAVAMTSPVVDDPGQDVMAGADMLVAARAELHRLARRPLNQLLLDHQDDVAAALGYRDADELMAAVAAAGRTIAWASDETWRRVRSALAGPRGRQPGSDRSVGPGLVLRDDEVALAPGTDPAADSSLLFRAAAASARFGVPFARSSLDRLAAAVRATPPWTSERHGWNDATRDALVALLGSGASAVPVLETLDQLGLLTHLLPEWRHVRNRPQRNAYHRFTVDRHLIEAAVGAAALARSVARPDLLLIGALLHDIGKGIPGEDHTVAGMRIVGEVAARMGFAPPDVAVLVRLVEHHLLLADTATRRDLDDRLTIDFVARAVGDVVTLELLAALTEADSLATGPSAWSDWKAGLISVLTDRVRARLAGSGSDEVVASTFPGPAEKELMAAGRVGLSATGSHVTVVAPDRPGLLWRVAAVLALSGVDVRSAMLGGEDGMAVEVFDVEPAIERLPDWDRVGRDLEQALEGRLALDARLAERERAYASRFRARAAQPADPRVLFHDGVSSTATVVEVRAPDGVGVLCRITRALSECELDVRSAKVVTLGHEVVDTFYVRTTGGEPVDDPEQRHEVTRAVLGALAARD